MVGFPDKLTCLFTQSAKAQAEVRAGRQVSEDQLGGHSWHQDLKQMFSGLQNFISHSWRICMLELGL